MAGVPVDANFFRHYDDLGNEAQSLTGVEGGLADAKQVLQDEQQRLKKVKAELAHNRKKQKYHEKRIDDCHNHCVKSKTFCQPCLWCSGGVEGKIAREEQKLEDFKAAEPGLVAKEKKLEEETVPAAQKRKDGLEDQNARKEEINNERLQMYEGAIAGSPSPLLTALNQAVATWETALNTELQIQAGVQEVGAGLRAALGHYQQAMGLLQQALMTNRGAQINNVLDGNEGIERMQQMQRNMMMNQAKRAVEEGASTLEYALGRIPPQAAQRHPQAAAGLGDVNIPHIRQAGLGVFAMEVFGGDGVQFAGGLIAGAKIRSSMKGLEDCMQAVSQQIAICDSLLIAISMAVAERQHGLLTEQQKVVTEKMRIFQELRDRALNRTPVAAPVQPPVATPVAEFVGAAAVAPPPGVNPMSPDNATPMRSVGMQPGMQPPPMAQPYPQQPNPQQPYAQPYAQPQMAQPMAQPTAQPIAHPTAQPMAEPMAQPVAEPASDATASQAVPQTAQPNPPKAEPAHV